MLPLPRHPVQQPKTHSAYCARYYYKTLWLYTLCREAKSIFKMNSEHREAKSILKMNSEYWEAKIILKMNGKQVIFTPFYIAIFWTISCWQAPTAWRPMDQNKSLTHYDWEKPARIPVKFWNFFCPHPRVGLNKLVSKRPCKANPSPLKAKFGQI